MLPLLLAAAQMRQVGLRSQEMRSPTVEEDPRFHRKEKILPSEYFISTGPGEITGKYYACMMSPNLEFDPNQPDDTVVIDMNKPYKIIAKCYYGFKTPHEALMDASRQFPSLPVLIGGDKYEYPHYQVPSKFETEAQTRQERRATKLAENLRKTKEGQEQANRDYTFMQTVRDRRRNK